MKLYIFTLIFFIRIACGNDVDTIEIDIIKPLWIGVVSKESVLQLINKSGIIVSEKNLPRRTAVFEQRHKLVLNNGQVLTKKERSYSLKVPDLHSNVKVSKYLYTGVGKKKTTVAMVDSPITIELAEVIKHPDGVCRAKNPSKVFKRIINNFFTTEHITTQTDYNIDGATREESYLSQSAGSKNKPPKSTEISGDLTNAHLHYLLHNVFIGEESAIPTYVRLGTDMGFMVDTNRVSRYIDGESQPDGEIHQHTIDSMLDFLRGEAISIWQVEMSRLASSRKPEAGSQYSQEAYRDDMLGTTCSSTIIRVMVSTAQVSLIQGIIIIVPELDHGILLYDNSYGEVVGDEHKIDVSMGPRLSRLSVRRKSSSEGDLSALKEYQSGKKSGYRKSMFHVYDDVAANYDVPRHAVSANAIIPVYDYLCRPKEDSKNHHSDKDDDDKDKDCYGGRMAPFLMLPPYGSSVTDL